MTKPAPLPGTSKSTEKKAAKKAATPENKTDFQIETDVPMPPTRTSVTKYPFASLEPGHSFLIPAKPDDRKNALRRVRSASATYRKKFAQNTQFAVRQTDDGVRVWRIADKEG